MRMNKNCSSFTFGINKNKKKTQLHVQTVYQNYCVPKMLWQSKRKILNFQIDWLKNGVQRALAEHSVQAPEEWVLRLTALSHCPSNLKRTEPISQIWRLTGAGNNNTQLSPRRIRAWMGAELLLCPWKRLPSSRQDTYKTKPDSKEQCQSVTYSWQEKKDKMLI